MISVQVLALFGVENLLVITIPNTHVHTVLFFNRPFTCQFCFPNTDHVKIPRRFKLLLCSLKRLRAWGTYSISFMSYLGVPNSSQLTFKNSFVFYLFLCFFPLYLNYNCKYFLSTIYHFLYVICIYLYVFYFSFLLIL